MSESPAYYANIPADVRYCKNITPNAKLLYGEISALCNKEGHCWAANKYFADLYEVSQSTISEWLNSLKKEGFIVVEIGWSNARKVWLREAAPLRENLIPSSGKAEYPSSGKAEHNTTRDNTTKNNKGLSLPESKKGEMILQLESEPKVSPAIPEKKRKGSGTATETEVENFCESIGVLKLDGTGMFWHFEEKGWPKNWQAAIRKWKAFGYLPSQKQKPGSFQKPEAKVEMMPSQAELMAARHGGKGK